uniref:Uncharacterized protein n=1 Tax=Oryza brachyantha TaxID=4533 RepID=J3L2Z1_ORYBR
MSSCGKVLMFIYLLGSFVAQGDIMHMREPLESMWQQGQSNKITIIGCFETYDCTSIGKEDKFNIGSSIKTSHQFIGSSKSWVGGVEVTTNPPK